MIDGGWGDRRGSSRFASTHGALVPLVAEVDGRIVGHRRGDRQRSGRLGRDDLRRRGLRGRGLGTAVTEAVIDELDGRGCDLAGLLASPVGQPIYERLGFRAEVDYRLIAARARRPRPRPSRRTPADVRARSRRRPAGDPGASMPRRPARIGAH